MGTVQSAQDTFTLRDDTSDKANGSSQFTIHEFSKNDSQTGCDPQLSATGFILFETQTRLKKLPPKDSQPPEIWWPAANPNMALVNLMWILQNLTDFISPKRRRQIRELIVARESKLRIWDSVQIGNASQLKRMESALSSFVADIQLAVGTRAWDLNMYRMRSAITAAQLTKKNGQELTNKQGDTNTIISGFQKTRFCMMTWENLRDKPEEAVDPSLSTKSHLHTANNMGKRRTNTGLSPAPKKGKKLPEGKTGRMSLQLLSRGHCEPRTLRVRLARRP